MFFNQLRKAVIFAGLKIELRYVNPHHGEIAILKEDNVTEKLTRFTLRKPDKWRNMGKEGIG